MYSIKRYLELPKMLPNGQIYNLLSIFYELISIDMDTDG
jgi:hypothetical protein